MQGFSLAQLLGALLLAAGTLCFSRTLSSDLLYFPDQAEYIKLSQRCAESLILWPGNGRCYREGERGPCNVGRVLAFNDKIYRPYCRDE